jgi:hypothetical protein
MKSLSARFNNYLAAFLVLAVLAGCASSEERQQKKAEAEVRLFLEAEYDTGNKTEVVPIYRSAPTPLRIFKQPFLDSAYLTEAAVVDTMGGFAMVLRFDFHGTLTLENYSTAYKGSRVAIQAVFPESRWLAAPRVATRITDGTLAFTPDATREEAERIVRGLNNVAVKLGNQTKPGKPKKAE